MRKPAIVKGGSRVYLDVTLLLDDLLEVVIHLQGDGVQKEATSQSAVPNLCLEKLLITHSEVQ